MNPSFITLNLGSALPVTSGGTGLTTIPTNGQLLIGNGTGYTLNPLTPGAGIGVTNGVGLITVANTGVLSNIASSGISVSSATGNVTIANTGVLSWSGGSTGLTPATATTGAVTLAGTLGAGYGGTGLSTYAVGDFLYASGATALSRLADVATGSALISGGVATAPSWGKIGLTTHVSGTLPIANGGTNATATPTAGAIAYGTGSAYAFTAAGTSGQVLTSAGAGTPTWATPTTGTVTAVSVVSANGLAGTSSGGATPALTLSTTVTGVVKGNGTALSAATAATDYVAPSAYASANGLTMATARLLGRTTASTGAAEEISVAGGLTLSGGTLTGTSGTVTAVSVVSANGLAGSSSGGATPALTLSTTITGLLKGNGTAISAATSGTDYAPATSGTSILYGNGSGGFSNVTIGTGVAFTAGTLSATGSGGTVTSVAALTLGTTGTDLSSTVANGTTTPVITLQVPTASASNRGALSAADWTTFNNKGSGTVTSVAQSFTGGLISVAGSPITTSGTLALTVAGTSGGIPYFSSASTWATSAALAAGSLVQGGGAGVAPSTITTGTGVVTALGVNTGTAGAFVVNGGALGTPSSGTVTNLTGTASININGTVGATTPTTGKFTTIEGTDTTDATSTTAAAVKTAGGLAVAKKIYVGDNIVPAAAKGVNFSGNTPAAGMTSQLLNWYEQGTWTPTQGTGLTVIGTFSSQGTYSRAGRIVTVTAQLAGSTSVATAGGGVDICAGLPFAAGSTSLGIAIGIWTAPTGAAIISTTIYASSAISAVSTILISATYQV